MKINKIKTAAGLFTIIFSILLGCGRRESGQEILLLPVEEETGKMTKEPENLANGPLSAEDENEKDAAERILEQGGQRENVPQRDCVVHICGAVKNPGIYVMTEGNRIFQAVEMAGGFREDADQDYLNQADLLTDGSRVYIPTKEEVEEAGGGKLLYAGNGNGQTEDAKVSSSLVNINTAGEDLLCTLSGVGSSRAKSIIAYREQNGAFKKIEDIMNVEGIKDGLFQKIKDSITV